MARVPDEDDRERMACPDCAHVHYDNPTPVVCTVVEVGARLLLCRRAIEPGHGLWTVPGGFHELGESSAEGAARECFEEACAQVEIVAPLGVFDMVDIGQVHTFFRARMVDDHFAVGPESLEVRLFDPADIPWDTIAFPVTVFVLRLLLADREQGRRRVHWGALRWSGHGDRFDAARYALEQHHALDLRD